jgi:hypothetical protein
MSRQYRINGLQLGEDIENIALYHTEVTGSNLIYASVTGSLFETSGVVVEVDDNVTKIIARCLDGGCQGRTGSLDITPYQPGTRYFTVISDGQGYVSATLPEVIANTSSSLYTGVNYNVDSLFVIQATDFYPYNFEGWYNDVSGSGTLLSTDNTLSIGENDYTASLTDDKIYAYFG